MITEDYCSFKIAKLLKKKGFDWECISYYVDDEPDDVKYSFCGETNSDWESRCCSAPTLQMACKWLRLKHNLFIEVKVGTDLNGEFLYMADIYNLKNPTIEGRYEPIFKADYYLTINPKSPEEAISEALKYCLENLI